MFAFVGLLIFQHYFLFGCLRFFFFYLFFFKHVYQEKPIDNAGMWCWLCVDSSKINIEWQKQPYSIQKLLYMTCSYIYDSCVILQHENHEGGNQYSWRILKTHIAHMILWSMLTFRYTQTINMYKNQHKNLNNSDLKCFMSQCMLGTNTRQNSHPNQWKILFTRMVTKHF